MYVLVQKIAFQKIDVIPTDVQVHIANELPIITIVDLNAEATTSQVTIAEALA